MLAGLVVASFTVTPARRAATIVAPAREDEPATARVAPMSRGLARVPRTLDDLDMLASRSPTAEPTPAPEPEVASQPLRESAPEPEPEATPDPTPQPTPRPVARPVTAVTSPTTLGAELHMLELINVSRTSGGLVPLAMDVGVASTARAHSAAEAQVRFVYHDGADGTASSRNVPACGSGWYGENTGKIWNGNVDALHIEFMAEPWLPINHRTNIMDPLFRRVGIGAVIGPDAMYMTMVFCR
jgi:uncharacterized protein YkwD